MMAKAQRLSIICPAFQEQEVLPLFHEELCRVLASLETDYLIEIIYVDDGSKDGTLSFLHGLATRDSRVRFLSFTRNFGKEAAMLAGLEHCTGDLIVTLDTDLQHPPAVIPLLLEKAKENYQVVMALRQEYRPPSWFKTIGTRIFYKVMKLFGEVPIDAAGSDFLLLKRKALTAILKVQERHRFLKGLIYWLGFPQGVVTFVPNKRGAGTTKFTFGRLARMGTDCLFSFSQKPLKLATYLGLTVLMLGLVTSLGLLIQGFRNPDQFSWGWAYLLVSSHLFAGSILCSLGLLGEYLGRVFEQVKQRPLYVLKEDSQEANQLVMETSRKVA